MNPLATAKVVGDGVTTETYIKQLRNIERGHPEYVLSRSDLVEISKCPHRWIMGYQPPDSDAKDWGSLIDCMALSPDRFRIAYAMAPDMYPDSKTGEPKPWTWNANYCKAWRDERPGVTIIKPNEFEKATAALTVLMSDEQIRDLIKLSCKQVMVVAEYKDEETGITVPLKTLIDMVPPNGQSLCTWMLTTWLQVQNATSGFICYRNHLHPGKLPNAFFLMNSLSLDGQLTWRP